MQIIYIITELILLTTIIFLKNFKKEINAIVKIILGINILYIINMLVPLAISIINIKSSFLNLSIINIVLVTIYTYIKYKKDKNNILEKFTINKNEIFGLLLIILLCNIIGIIRFDNYKSIVYETTDPGVHYKMAYDYSKIQMPFTKENSQDELYITMSHSMPGYYINCGTFMNIVKNIIPSYYAMLIFDVFIFTLLSCTFYSTCIYINKRNNKNIFKILLLSCLYLGAYCLNNMIFGFGYLGVGMLITNMIINIWYIIEDKKINNNKIIYIILALFNTALFYSYYLFIPVVFLSQGLYIIYKFIKGKLSFFKMIMIGIITLIIPFILGFIYFILPGLISTGETVLSNGIQNEGYIYRNLWSNFVIFIPIFIYSFLKQIKEKNIIFLTFIFVIQIIFILITLILGLKYNMISSYYYYKSYFIFWTFFLIYIMYYFNIDNEINVKMSNIFISYIIVLFLIGASRIEERIINKNILFNNNVATLSYLNIYVDNGSKILNSEPILDEEELILIEETKKYQKKCLNDKNEFPVYGNYLKKIWYYSITGIIPIYNHEKGNLSKIYEEKFPLQDFMNDNSTKCLIVIDSEVDNSELDYNKFNILYSNQKGKILEKK